MDAKWLNEQFEKHPEKGKSDLSGILGMQASGISKMLAGTRQIKAKEYMLMRQFFGQPVRSDRASETKTGNLTSGLNDLASQNWQAKTEILPHKYDVVTVSDAAMVPDFLPGERLLIDTDFSLQQKPGIFAIEESGRADIRIVEQIAASKIKISAIVKDSPPRIFAAGKIKLLGRVVAKLNWI